MTMSTLSTGGYLVRNKDSFESKYICPLCTNLFKNPAQLDCGHRQCYFCISPIDNYIKCVECEETTIFSEIREDKGFQKDMQILTVDCIACEWRGKLKDYQEHLQQSHRQFKCPHCGEIFDSTTLLEQHTERSCMKIFVNCILHEYGCKEQILRSDLENHYRTPDHQRTVLLSIEQAILQLNKQYQTSTIADTSIKMETSEASSDVTTAVSTVSTTEKPDDNLKQMHQIIDFLSNGIPVLQEELIRLNNELIQQSQLVETIEKSELTIKTSHEELSNVVNGMNTNFILLQQDLSSLKQKYEDHQVTSYDGTLIWKIDRFQEKMRDAQSERQVSIYSPPFRSSPTGYKMRARLYLYGDGNARRTHMSLFFVLMRSPHDAILPFPFSYKVTFCLFDQTKEQRHLIDSFRPDTKSNSFQRPRSDMNIASGIPKFAALTIFENPNNPYVKDDTMFIKVMVDFENTPKAILPYAFSLNPGLPMHTQQLMIRKENERRTQQSPATTVTSPVNNNTKKN